MFAFSQHAAHHQIFSFLAQTVHFKAMRSLFVRLLLSFFLSFVFPVLNILHHLSACVTMSMLSRAFILSCFLLRFSFARMTSRVQTVIIVVFLEFIGVFHPSDLSILQRCISLNTLGNDELFKKEIFFDRCLWGCWETTLHTLAYFNLKVSFTRKLPQVNFRKCVTNIFIIISQKSLTSCSR